MTRMKLALPRWLMVAVLALAVVAPLLTQAGTASACTCEPPDLNKQMATAAAVFRGEVEEISDASDSHYRIEFDVEEHWKGEPARETFVYTHKSSATCGATFQEDHEYFVVASANGDRLETTSCNFNVDFEAGPDSAIAEIETLGAGTRAQDADDDDGDDPPSQDGDDGDEPTDDGDGSGGNGDGDEPADTPGAEGNSASNVDPDPLNVSAVVLSALVAAGAVIVVAGRK